MKNSVLVFESYYNLVIPLVILYMSWGNMAKCQHMGIWCSTVTMIITLFKGQYLNLRIYWVLKFQSLSYFVSQASFAVRVHHQIKSQLSGSCRTEFMPSVVKLF